MNEVKRQVSDLRLVLRKLIEPGLLHTPIELRLPVLHESPHAAEPGAILPALVIGRSGPANLVETLPQVCQRTIIDTNLERPNSHLEADLRTSLAASRVSSAAVQDR